MRMNRSLFFQHTFVLYASATSNEALYNPSNNSIPTQESNGYKVAAAL